MKNRRDWRRRSDWLEERHILRQGGHEVIAASPKVGVNTIYRRRAERSWPAPTW